MITALVVILCCLLQVYRVIVDIIKEIGMCDALLLFCNVLVVIVLTQLCMLIV